MALYRKVLFSLSVVFFASTSYAQDEDLLDNIKTTASTVKKTFDFIPNTPSSPSGLLPMAESSSITKAYKKLDHKSVLGQRRFLKREQEMIKDCDLTLHSVLLFDGDDIISDTIQGFSHGSYSHIGLGLLDTKTQKKFVFESKGSATQILRLIKPQVQIDLYDNVVPTYGGIVAERMFNFDAGHEPDVDKVLQSVNKYLGVSYEQHPLELIEACSRSNDCSNSSSMFCSELVAQVLQDHGYMDKSIYPNNYIPRDFGKLQESLRLLNVSLSDEIVVRTASQKGFIEKIKDDIIWAEQKIVHGVGDLFPHHAKEVKPSTGGSQPSI